MPQPRGIADPHLILLVGLPGSGKSTLAHALQALLPNARLLTTETVRATLFAYESAPNDTDFSPLELEVTYRAVTLMAKTALQLGGRVIVDGVYRSAQQRDTLLTACADWDSATVCLHVDCEPEEARRRLIERKKTNSLAPAGVVTYERLREIFEPPAARFQRLDTTGGEDPLALLKTVGLNVGPVDH